MFLNLMEDSKAWILRHFPERQIYLRSSGEVSYHTLSTRLQVILMTLGSAILFWCLLTVFNLLWGNNPLRSPAQHNKLVTAEYERLLEDAEARYEMAQLQLNQQQESFERAAKSFQDKHAAIAQFINHPSQAGILPALPNTLAGNGQILMEPVARETVKREARRKFLHQTEMHTGTDLDQPMMNLDKTQNAMLKSAEVATHDKIERNRAIIEATKLNINTVLSATTMGVGGPATQIENLNTGNQDPAAIRLTQMRARATEANQLANAIASMPLGHPVASEHYRTSSYGMRRDPFTKRPTMHHALDFASFRLAPIVATAGGTVKFVGIKGGYGRVVEVDHGHGFTTRYAHLAKSYVKRGQKVEAGDKLGGMGSTGRSTSTHLHYEIRFQGQTQNPDNFLKAGRYVQQN